MIATRRTQEKGAATFQSGAARVNPYEFTLRCNSGAEDDA
jgi:hypothetical protein